MACTSLSLAPVASLRQNVTVSSPLKARSVPAVQAAPLAKGSRSVAVRASSEEGPNKATAVSSVLLGAAAAALLSFGSISPAFAEASPGSVAETAGQKADELLKAADKLTTNESPPRFGPGRSGPDQTGKLAQQGGSGAKEAVQGTQNDITKGVGQAKSVIGDVKGELPNPFSAIQGALADLKGNADSAAKDVQSKASDVAQSAPNPLSGLQGDVKSAAKDASSKASDIASSNPDISGAAQGLKGDIKSATKDASSKASNVASNPLAKLQGKADSVKGDIEAGAKSAQSGASDAAQSGSNFFKGFGK